MAVKLLEGFYNHPQQVLPKQQRLKKLVWENWISTQTCRFVQRISFRGDLGSQVHWSSNSWNFNSFGCFNQPYVIHVYHQLEVQYSIQRKTQNLFMAVLDVSILAWVFFWLVYRFLPTVSKPPTHVFAIWMKKFNEWTLKWWFEYDMFLSNFVIWSIYVDARV